MLWQLMGKVTKKRLQEHLDQIRYQAYDILAVVERGILETEGEEQHRLEVIKTMLKMSDADHADMLKRPGTHVEGVLRERKRLERIHVRLKEENHHRTVQVQEAHHKIAELEARLADLKDGGRVQRALAAIEVIDIPHEHADTYLYQLHCHRCAMDYVKGILEGGA